MRRFNGSATSGKRLGKFTGFEDAVPPPLPGNGPVPAFPRTGLNDPAATYRAAK
jgi:hypothetical protein